MDKIKNNTVDVVARSESAQASSKAHGSQFANPAKTARMLLRVIRASEPVSRVELAERLNVNRSTITDICKPLISAGLLRETSILSTNTEARAQGRPRVGLTLNGDSELFAGVSIGVRRTQVGISTLNSEILGEEEFETSKDARAALAQIQNSIERLYAIAPNSKLKIIVFSDHGVTYSMLRKLNYATHLDCKYIDILYA